MKKLKEDYLKEYEKQDDLAYIIAMTVLTCAFLGIAIPVILWIFESLGR